MVVLQRILHSVVYTYDNYVTSFLGRIVGNISKPSPTKTDCIHRIGIDHEQDCLSILYMFNNIHYIYPCFNSIRTVYCFKRTHAYIILHTDVTIKVERCLQIVEKATIDLLHIAQLKLIHNVLLVWLYFIRVNATLHSNYYA